MLRVTTLHASSATATARYYAQYLTAAPGEVPGVWSGGQAAALGLSGTVEVDGLELLLSGRDPVSGSLLGRELVDRYTVDGRLERATAQPSIASNTPGCSTGDTPEKTSTSPPASSTGPPKSSNTPDKRTAPAVAAYQATRGEVDQANDALRDGDLIRHLEDPAENLPALRRRVAALDTCQHWANGDTVNADQLTAAVTPSPIQTAPNSHITSGRSARPCRRGPTTADSTCASHHRVSRRSRIRALNSGSSKSVSGSRGHGSTYRPDRDGPALRRSPAGST